MKWITLQSEMGTVKGMRDPLPKGPYAIVYQHDCNKFELNPHLYKNLETSNEFKLHWGTAVYTVGQDLKPLMVAYYWDTTG